MKLARGEELLLDTRPHPLAFAGLYMLYTYILAVGLFFLFINKFTKNIKRVLFIVRIAVKKT